MQVLADTDSTLGFKIAVTMSQGTTKIIEQLLSKGADFNEKSNDGLTPLTISEELGFLEAAKLLRRAGANK